MDSRLRGNDRQGGRGSLGDAIRYGPTAFIRSVCVIPHGVYLIDMTRAKQVPSIRIVYHDTKDGSLIPIVVIGMGMVFNYYLFDCFADVNIVSSEPLWLRESKTTPVVRRGGLGVMAFADPPLTADPHSMWAYFFPLPIAFEGQGKEMSFSPKGPPRGHQTYLARSNRS
ncbi:MAG: hypothetical protein JXM79_24115 [Sedimentisphaerales bacterium]|nr:hypothetical protein [Sedimentisphaerales bacterium]